MTLKSTVLTAALVASVGLILFSTNTAISDEQSKPAKNTLANDAGAKDTTAKEAAAKSHLRTGKEAIQSALAEKIDLDVNEVPLAEVVRRLRMTHHVQILFDMNALKDAAIDPTALPVTLTVKNINLSSALKLLLSQFQLTYIIRDEVLQITTRDKASTVLSPRVYDVQDVLSKSEDGMPDFDSLIDVIVTTVASQSWSDTGGPGSIMTISPSSIIISQTQEVHEEIDDLLHSIRRTAELAKAGKFENSGVADESDAEKSILKAMQESVDIDFHDTPFTEVYAQLAKQHHVQIQFDVNALKDAAIDPSALPTTYSVKGVTLKSALNGILDQFNLTWVPQNEVLQITTKDKANTMLITKLYPIEDLIQRKKSPDGSQTQLTPDASSFVNAISTTVSMQTWSSVGGPGTIESYDKDGLILVVSQTREVHDEIADLLGQLREVCRKQKDETSKPEDKPQDPNAMVLRVYDLKVSAPNAPAMTPQEVMEVVKGLVEPKSWGQGEAFIRGATGKLIVRQTPAVQEAVAKLLDELGTGIPTVRGLGKGGRLKAGIPVVGANGGMGGAAGGGGGF